VKESIAQSYRSSWVEFTERDEVLVKELSTPYTALFMAPEVAVNDSHGPIVIIAMLSLRMSYRNGFMAQYTVSSGHSCCVKHRRLSK
jgi:hypothetical protein